MPTLEEYLSSNYVHALQQISDLDADITAAVRTLIASQTTTGWSYEHHLGETPGSGLPSIGIMAVVLYSIGRSLEDSVFCREDITVRLPSLRVSAQGIDTRVARPNRK